MAANPYTQGLMVAGTGPAGASTNWATQMTPNGLVANTGFGQAPIYTADQFNQWASSGNSPFYDLKGPFNGNAPAWANQAPNSGLSAGSTFVIHTPDGGQQNIDYKLDPKTGYYVPSSASGASNSTGLVDNLIKYGAMAGSAVAGGAGALGYGSAGPGASALGGSADAIGGAAGGAAAGGAAAGGGAMTFDPSGMADQIAATAGQNVAPQLATDASNIAAAGDAGITADIGSGGSSLLSSLNSAKTTYDRIKLANQLLKIVGGNATGPSQQQQGMFGGTLVGQGSGGLTGNMKMMLQANAQAQMNGQPLPFPGLGGMGR